ncbi:MULTISPECIES: GDSL-type esterase/lipase family protein [unclassified Corynebacterium]|uniref:GDSL-type esterase/lipase family protein n=1 Tax=unclassified Corynebacterium TaxID=2624378 RepID=UPI0029CA67D5|nr:MULTISPECIES: GDSL-type esterase/lipase family protein [unclassified Corynebacterium]WPF67221.1 GDSL-type esterase/lipase family protein [Corynebacterium sp. 22KM0430]WPF69710.1 GDSL-type esterase/lipase family protein [Corynebacterium sp. 21KM1197]
MSIRSLCQRATILAASATVALGVAAVPATASPNALVGFGDSVMANPRALDHLSAGLPIPEEQKPNVHNNCATDPNGMVKQVARIKGMEAKDYSCPGASVSTGGKRIDAQINDAIAQGALDNQTREVLIQIGFNDTYLNLADRKSPEEIHRNYVAAMTAQIGRIRQAAPNAAIKVVGYPSISDNKGTCLIQLGNNIHSFEGIPLSTDLENMAEAMNRDAAAQAGVQYIDLRSASMGHGMCAPDGERWYGAAIDFGQPRNVPIHMTDLGVAKTSEIIAAS